MLAALQRMAPHVSGAKPATIHAHLVAGFLPEVIRLAPRAHKSGEKYSEKYSKHYEPPPHWIEGKPGDGAWDLYAQNWDAARRAMRLAVRDGFEPPCPGTPIAEGGAMDSGLARSRGLERLPCGERVQFWEQGQPKARVLSARLAGAEYAERAR